MESCDIVLCGNHDMALSYGAANFTNSALTSLRYHRELLMPNPHQDTVNSVASKRWEFLRSLPCREIQGDLLFTHASPSNPLYEYLQERDVQLHNFHKLSRNFDCTPHLAFIGHTHVPGIITSDYAFLTPEQISNCFTPEKGKKAIINVGSVGQPRDGNPRARFVTIEEDKIQYHEVKYDIHKTIEKLKSCKLLDQRLAKLADKM
jgi:diadenosine tetraphosphatase ApaH/serine/threonine PP2A family protein phosphatase